MNYLTRSDALEMFAVENFNSFRHSPLERWLKLISSQQINKRASKDLHTQINRAVSASMNVLWLYIDSRTSVIWDDFVI